MRTRCTCSLKKSSRGTLCSPPPRIHSCHKTKLQIYLPLNPLNFGSSSVAGSHAEVSLIADGYDPLLGVPWLVQLMTQAPAGDSESTSLTFSQFTATAAERNNTPKAKWNHSGDPVKKHIWFTPSPTNHQVNHQNASTEVRYRCAIDRCWCGDSKGSSEDAPERQKEDHWNNLLVHFTGVNVTAWHWI